MRKSNSQRQKEYRVRHFKPMASIACKQCLALFVPKRTTAMFCDSRCRNQYRRDNPPVRALAVHEILETREEQSERIWLDIQAWDDLDKEQAKQLVMDVYEALGGDYPCVTREGRYLTNLTTTYMSQDREKAKELHPSVRIGTGSGKRTGCLEDCTEWNSDKTTNLAYWVDAPGYMGERKGDVHLMIAVLKEVLLDPQGCYERYVDEIVKLGGLTPGVHELTHSTGIGLKPREWDERHLGKIEVGLTSEQHDSKYADVVAKEEDRQVIVRLRMEQDDIARKEYEGIFKIQPRDMFGDLI